MQARRVGVGPAAPMLGVSAGTTTPQVPIDRRMSSTLSTCLLLLREPSRRRPFPCPRRLPRTAHRGSRARPRSYVGTYRARGMTAHSTISVDIIETTLCVLRHSRTARRVRTGVCVHTSPRHCALRHCRGCQFERLKVTALCQRSGPGRQRRQGRTDKGCRDAIPNFWARRPVMNGRTAEPAWPAPAMYPEQAVMSQRGRMVVEWFMRMGNIGPRRRPTKETATAFSISEGTTQTVTSSLMWCTQCARG